jgi:23S rRNA pseudouridine1911/1915/1917 synthase
VSIIKNNSISTYEIKESINLLPFLLKTLNNKSRNAVKSILTRGQVSVDGYTITQHNHPLKPGMTVGILSNEASIRLSALDGLTILHEDAAIIVINKAPGILSMATNRSKKSEADAYRQLTDYVKKSNRKNRIHIVHRLDRDTSGVMVYAKTKEAKEKLQNNWQEVVKERTYTAVVDGSISKKKGTITSWLKENEALKMYSVPEGQGGKEAVTHYKKIDGNASYSLLEVALETGRKNQIRVHMADIGHPVVGDRKYSTNRDNPLRRLGLHATTLSFIHPTTEKLVTHTVNVPESFNNLIK